jgi:Zn-dependent protease with chaperone function
MVFANWSNYPASNQLVSLGHFYPAAALIAGCGGIVRRSSFSRGLAILLAFVLACPAWMLAAVGNEPALPDPGLAAPKDQQIQLGQKAVAEVYQQMPVLPDSSALTRYVQSLGANLQRVIPEQYNWPYQFHVIQQKDINAFALPGGPIFVNVGTIMAADNEAELAGVIAHEMSHVYMQHSIKGMRKQGTTQAAGQILGGILGAVLGGTAGALANLGAQIGAGALSMKYSRADEAQADAVGAIIMYKAGYNPIRLAQFFQKLEQQGGGGGGPQFLSDHPNPGNRVQAVRSEVKNWPSRQYHDDSPQFVQAHKDASRVRAYTAQEIAQMAKNGQIHNVNQPGGVQTGPPGPTGTVNSSDVMPSGSFQQFQGPFSMDYPSNWQAAQDQQSGGVTIAPQAGVSQGGIAYGAVIGPFQAQNANTIDDATQQLISTLQQQNQGMRQAGRIQSIRVNGVSGRSVDLLGQSPIAASNGQPLQEHDWLVTLPYSNGAVISLVFVAPEKDFSRLRPTFEHMLKTFRLNQ